MLNRSVLPIASTLVAPELTVEPWDVQECEHMRPGTPLLATSIQLPSIVDSGKVLYEIQVHLNYWYTLQYDDPFRNPCTSMSIPAYDVPRHPASDACLDLLVFYDPQLDMQWKLSTYYFERNSNFILLKNYLSLLYSFGPWPITSPVYGIVSWCPMCRLLRTSDSANFLLEILATCMSMYHYTHLWDVYTKFGITRDGTCDQTL